MKLTGAFLTIVILLTATSSSSDKLTEALAKFNTEYPQEKVYLHLNKPYYYSSEDIWFKVYLAAGPDHLPSVFSDNVYAELIDQEGNMLMRHRIVLENGFGKGDFDLPDLASGNYTIRAYSHWMRNFDEAFFYQKQVAIISPIDGNPPAKEQDTELAIDFFPEGGDLIENVPSRMAVKLSAPGIMGNAQFVMLYSSEGELVEQKKTNDDGIALFELSGTEQGYYAMVRGQQGRYELPEAKTTGYSLDIDALSHAEHMKATINTYNPGKTSQTLYLIGQTRGVITYASQLDFSENSVSVNVPRQALMSGITQFTLFNKSWLPEAERLVFHQGAKPLQVELTTDQAVYTGRDSTIVSLKVKDLEGNPVQGSFSLTALDSGQINASLESEHIMSNFLLSSDLKGHIRNPVRFFGANAKDHQQELDLLLMTHGWRRFQWKDLLAGKYPEIAFGVQRGITVQGRLLTEKGGEAVEGGTISHIGTYNNVPSMASTTSLDEGFFAIGNLYFHEMEENYLKGQIKGKRKKMKKLYVEVDTAKTEPAPVHITQLPLLGLDTAVIEDHIEKSIERQMVTNRLEFDDEATDLGEVVVEGIRVEDRDKYAGGEWHRVDFDSMVQFMKYGANPLDVIKGRLPNVLMRGNQASMEPILTYNRTIRTANTNPLILLDGLPISAAQLRNMPAGRIKKAEVYRGTNELLKDGRDPREAMIGGVLEFYSRTDEEMVEFYRLMGDKNVKTLPGGFYLTREYAPMRHDPTMPVSPIPDRRMLIHWEPLIKTDQNGEATISFYNADLPTTIRVDLQGLTLNGVPVAVSTSYKTTGISYVAK